MVIIDDVSSKDFLHCCSASSYNFSSTNAIGHLLMRSLGHAGALEIDIAAKTRIGGFGLLVGHTANGPPGGQTWPAAIVAAAPVAAA